MSVCFWLDADVSRCCEAARAQLPGQFACDRDTTRATRAMTA
jgi:hypothetical protein